MEFSPLRRRRGKNKDISLKFPEKSGILKNPETVPARTAKARNITEPFRTADEKLLKIFKCEKAAANGALVAEGQTPFCAKAARQPL